jgi:hypothetical protein
MRPRIIFPGALLAIPALFALLALLSPALFAQDLPVWRLSPTPPDYFDAANLPNLPNFEAVLPEEVVVPYFVVTGPLAAPDDLLEEAGALYEAMSQELMWQSTIFNFYTVVVSPGDLPDVPSQDILIEKHKNARYVISGAVSRDEYDDENGEAIIRKTYTLTAWIPDSQSASPYVQVSSTFIDDPWEVLDYIPFLVWQITSVFPVDTVPLPKNGLAVPAQADGEDTWDQENFAFKHQWLYLGLQVGGSGRFYDRSDNRTRNIGMAADTALRAEFQFFSRYWSRNYFSLSVISGLALNMDNPNYRDYLYSDSSMLMSPVKFNSFSLSFPLALKVNYKPGPLAFGLYSGVYYNLLLQRPPSNDFPLGYTLGLEAGTRVGPGVLYLDLHYAADLEETVFPGVSGLPDLRYTRSVFGVSLGYSFGFFQKAAP